MLQMDTKRLMCDNRKALHLERLTAVDNKVERQAAVVVVQQQPKHPENVPGILLWRHTRQYTSRVAYDGRMSHEHGRDMVSVEARASGHL